MQKNILARNEWMLLLHWPEWPEPEAASEQGVWQWCDIMTSNSPCGWKVCLLPPVSRGMKRERDWETERKLAGKRVHVRVWERQRSGERECDQREGEGLTERNWQASEYPCEREVDCAKEQEWRPLSTWNTHQTRTEETLPSPNSTLRSDLQSLSITYCKSSQNIHIHKFKYNNII